ncbi:nucleotidyltransferase [Methanolobus psychrotolerans]|uniref:nucleotidyltransferase n=1 Tax=Methanolobus psychrotolerans TaxID=1874706 RepID=UPI000B91CF09|nr:nucleotidyltransferase [Methanolobus psychrotolerans]
MAPKLFDKQYLQAEFEKLDGLLAAPVNLYLIGGGSMSFQKYKTATKDIDVVVRSDDELKIIKTALKSIGYTVPVISGSYEQMGARAIFENTDEFRWDIFVNVICDGLQLSDGMINRSQELFKLKNISVHMISPEDIFVFKAITTRERDREDMYSLFSKGLDFEIIKKEIIWQNENKLTDFAWLAYFFTGLEEFFNQYSIYHPVFEELQDIAYEDMLIGMVKDKLKSQPMKIKDLSSDFEIEDVKAILKLLVEHGLVFKNKDGEFSLIHI